MLLSSWPKCLTHSSSEDEGEPAKFYPTKEEFFFIIITGLNFWHPEYALAGITQTIKFTVPPIKTDGRFAPQKC